MRIKLLNTYCFNNIGSWLVVFFYLANLLRMTNHSGAPYVMMILIAGLVGLYQLISNKNLNRFFLLSIFVIYTFTGFLSFFFVGNQSFSDLFRNMLLYGVAILMLAFPINYFQGTIVFYITAYTYANLLFSGDFIRDLMVSSENYISVMLILSACLYYIGLYNSKRNMLLFDVIPPIVCFILSILANGRGGIISSALFFFLLLGVYIKNLKRSNLILYKFSILIMSFLFIFVLWKGLNIIDAFLSLGKLRSDGLNTSRFYMWSSYFSKVTDSIIYFFNGAPLNDIPSIHQFENNTHNSFLQLHAFNGLFMFFAFFFLLYRSLHSYINNGNYVLFIISVIVIVRGMTDKFIFGQYGMPIMMCIVFLPFAYSKYNYSHKGSVKQTI